MADAQPVAEASVEICDVTGHHVVSVVFQRGSFGGGKEGHVCYCFCNKMHCHVFDCFFVLFLFLLIIFIDFLIFLIVLRVQLCVKE